MVQGSCLCGAIRFESTGEAMTKVSNNSEEKERGKLWPSDNLV